MLNIEKNFYKDVFFGILTEIGFTLALFLLMAFMAMIGEILSR